MLKTTENAIFIGMVDDIRPQPMDSKNKQNEQNLNQASHNTKPETVIQAEPHKVDSLVANSIGGITVGSRLETNKYKAKVHKFFSKGMELWPSTRNQKIAGSVIVAILLVGGVGGVYALKNLFNKPQQVASTPVVVEEPPAKTTEPSKLTGVEVNPKLNKRPVTSVQIENSPDARPQSGLKDAGIIFEAIAEGGITRFNVMYQEGQPKNIGPVRSIRPYYIDFFFPFDASVAHAGGSAEGLAKIQRLGVKDIDHGANADAFRRASDRYAPHNLYTSMSNLDAVSKRRGYKSSEFTSWPRKEEAKPTKPKVTKIDFVISSYLYDVHYDYDKKNNLYKRVMGGKPHNDRESGKQLTPKVVVAMVMDYSKNGIYSVYKTTGKNKIYVFQDGNVTEGTWQKKNSKSQFVFKDKNGKELALNAGQTWVTIVASPNDVKF